MARLPSWSGQAEQGPLLWEMGAAGVPSHPAISLASMGKASAVIPAPSRGPEWVRGMVGASPTAPSVDAPVGCTCAPAKCRGRDTERHPLHPEVWPAGSTAAPGSMSPSPLLQDLPFQQHAEPPGHCSSSKWVGKELTC